MASWCCPVRKKKRRSGVTPKGSSRRLKWERYMMNYSDCDAEEACPHEWGPPRGHPALKGYATVRRRRTQRKKKAKTSVAVGSGQDREAGEIFEFTGLLDGVTEVLGGKGDAKAEEASQEDSQGQVQLYIGLGWNIRQGGGLGDGYVGDFLLVEGFADARFFRLLGIQQVVVFGFLLRTDQVVKRGGGVAQAVQLAAISPGLAGERLTAGLEAGQLGRPPGELRFEGPVSGG